MGEKYRKRDNPSRDALREHGLTIEDLVDAYEKEKTIKGASALLGMNSGSFHRAMQAYGYVFTRGRRGIKKKHTSAVAEWLRKHADMPLPRNYKSIAETMDLPLATVRAYFKRRQEKLHEVLQEHNDIIGLDLFGLVDVSGHMITNKGLSTLRVIIDDFALCYVIKAVTLSGNRVTFVMQQDQYLEMFKPKIKDE